MFHQQKIAQLNAQVILIKRNARATGGGSNAAPVGVVGQKWLTSPGMTRQWYGQPDWPHGHLTAPDTVTSIKQVAPSPSRAMALARCWHAAVNMASSCSASGPSSMMAVGS